MLTVTMPDDKKVSTARVWKIDPVKQTLSRCQSTNIEDLISEVVGDNCDCLKFDNADNVVWVSDVYTNKRYAYFFEGMSYPFEAKRYSKALVISLGPNYLDDEAINDYLRFFDKRNRWNDS